MSEEQREAKGTIDAEGTIDAGCTVCSFESDGKCNHPYRKYCPYWEATEE